VRTTVLVVDDHASFRAAAAALLQADGYDVVGQACDAASALAEAVRLAPQVVVLDVRLPDETGFAVAERLAQLPVPPLVVLVSSIGREAFGAALQHTSALGFVPKRELSGTALAELLP
jgi:DNA-binding NarL/FixJ family response regulator